MAPGQAVNAGLRLWKYKWGSYGKQKAISDSELRKKNTEVKRQWQGVGECLVLSIMDSLFGGGIFTEKKLLVGGMWWPKVIHARTLYHVHTDKAEQTHD